jgi:hypothetical protein
VKPELVASMKSGLLGCSRTCSRGLSTVVVGSGVREDSGKSGMGVRLWSEGLIKWALMRTDA